uniref:Uncharacterized protein n=1 Tax=Parascaris univalens TaxID=6257 RepID=A0A915CL23_PARUN
MEDGYATMEDGYGCDGGRVRLRWRTGTATMEDGYGCDGGRVMVLSGELDTQRRHKIGPSIVLYTARTNLDVMLAPSQFCELFEAKYEHNGVTMSRTNGRADLMPALSVELTRRGPLPELWDRGSDVMLLMAVELGLETRMIKASGSVDTSRGFILVGFFPESLMEYEILRSDERTMEEQGIRNRDPFM